MDTLGWILGLGCAATGYHRDKRKGKTWLERITSEPDEGVSGNYNLRQQIIINNSDGSTVTINNYVED